MWHLVRFFIVCEQEFPKKKKKKKDIGDKIDLTPLKSQMDSSWKSPPVFSGSRKKTKMKLAELFPIKKSPFTLKIPDNQIGQNP